MFVKMSRCVAFDIIKIYVQNDLYYVKEGVRI